MSECYVPGCPDEPVVRFKYRDSLGEPCVEARCVACARAIRDSDKTSIIEAVVLSEEWESEQYDELTDEERKLIRRFTTGPFDQFAA